MARHLVVGTAGHIDHGKSALVEALTGTDPDRLKEEQLRGITIELGFADLDLGGERVVSFVDVPGHERFVRHMVAGAQGVDAVVLVVAADQGVQPQTREHLDICRLLGVPRGIVALSKCDLVDVELREVAELELRELLEGTFLADAALVPVSARTGEGLERLRAELANLFDAVPPRWAGGVARLPVDRSFVLRGFGTVVTGTLASGTLREGDEVEVLPGGKRGRIRGLQVHRHRVESAVAGQRTAVNLQSLDCRDVVRGATLTHPGALATTRRAWAVVTLVAEAPQILRRTGRVRFHQGTCERWARLRVLGDAGAGALRAVLALDGETVLAPGDRFILRRPAPVDTVGGGQVLDVRPPRAADAAAFPFSAAALDPEAALGLRLVRAGVRGALPDDLAPELGLVAAELGIAAERLASAGRLVRAAGRWVDGAAWRAARENVVAELGAWHASRPLEAGIAREELRGRAVGRMPQELWRVLLDGLAAEGRLALRGEQVAGAGHAVVLAGADLALAHSIEGRFREAGLEPPDLEQVLGAAEGARGRQIVAWLVAGGKLVRIQDGRLFHAAALAGLRAKLRERARTSKSIDVAEFKQLAGVTRKNAIPLLEQMDAERVTRRMGNAREVLPPAE